MAHDDMHSGIWTVPEVIVHVFNNEKKEAVKCFAYPR